MSTKKPKITRKFFICFSLLFLFIFTNHIFLPLYCGRYVMNPLSSAPKVCLPSLFEKYSKSNILIGKNIKSVSTIFFRKDLSVKGCKVAYVERERNMFFSGKDLTVCASDGEVINKVIITERDYLKE